MLFREGDWFLDCYSFRLCFFVISTVFSLPTGFSGQEREKVFVLSETMRGGEFFAGVAEIGMRGKSWDFGACFTDSVDWELLWRFAGSPWTCTARYSRRTSACSAQGSTIA